MAWLRRKASGGRHALGAAVTSIPSGPLQAAVSELSAPVSLPLSVRATPLLSLTATAESVAPTSSVEPALSAFSDDLLVSMAELVATGEAWTPASPSSPGATAAGLVDPVVAPHAPTVVHAPIRATVDGPEIVLQPVAHVELAVPVGLTAQSSSAVAPAVREAASARSSLEAALANLLPQQASTPADLATETRVPRVQLGFRDGTSTTLEPGSSQSLALEHLAQALARRD